MKRGFVRPLGAALGVAVAFAAARRAPVRALLCVAAASLAVSAPVAARTLSTAKTITGTARNDVLRGTAGSDTISGKAGNDTISALGGDDLIVGGPGADRIACGPGHDTVIADPQDTVGKDCETIKGLPPAKAPSKPHVPDGDYVGSTGQQDRFGFDVSGKGSTISGISFTADMNCGSQGFGIRLFGWGVRVPGPTTVAADGSFSTEISQATTNGLTTTGTLSGTLDLSGNGRGTLTVSLDDPQTNIDCTTGPLDWTVQRATTVIPVGHYVASTDQRRTVSFQTADGVTLTDLSADFVTTCSDGTARTFTFTHTATIIVDAHRAADSTGTLRDGTVVDITFDFDAAGFISGTMSFQHVPAPDTPGVLCDTGTITFSGGP